MGRIDIREQTDGRIAVHDSETGVEASGKTKSVALRNLARALERPRDEAKPHDSGYDFLRDELDVEPGEEPPE